MRNRQLSSRPDWPRLAALFVVLLLVQATAVSHLDLDEAHAADGACALCVGASVLTAGNLAVELALPLPFESGPVPEFVGLAAGPPGLDHRYARGPPQAT